MQFKKFRGKKFVADLFGISKKIKMKKNLDNSFSEAEGASAHVRDVIIGKNGHKQGLVMKVYNNSGMQTKRALKDFTMLSFLKKKGYPVPPTIRITEVNGKKFVVMTDLTKFGDKVIKYRPKNLGTIHMWHFENLVAIIGKKRAVNMVNEIEELIKKARQEENINVSDAFEIVFDSKTKKARFFLVDVDHANIKRRKAKHDFF